MSRALCPIVVILLLLLPVASLAAADRDAVAQRVRAELATLLKKDAATLPANAPVAALGADDLTVVEWTMALERAFPIDIPEDKILDAKAKTTSKDLTIAQMTSLVVEALAQPRKK